MTARARRHQVAIHYNILINVDGTHILDIAEQIIVHNYLPPSQQLRSRGWEPHAVAYDALDDALLRVSPLEELGSRRELVDVFSVPETVSHHAGGHDDG